MLPHAGAFAAGATLTVLVAAYDVPAHCPRTGPVVVPQIHGSAVPGLQHLRGDRRAAVPPKTDDPDEAARQAVWTGFKDAIRRGDTQGALQFVNPEDRRLRDFVLALTPQQRARIDAILPPIRLVEVYPDGRTAIYEAIRVTAGVLNSYEITFVRDLEGRWVLYGF